MGRSCKSSLACDWKAGTIILDEDCCILGNGHTFLQLDGWVAAPLLRQSRPATDPRKHQITVALPSNPP